MLAMQAFWYILVAPSVSIISFIQQIFDIPLINFNFY